MRFEKEEFATCLESHMFGSNKDENRIKRKFQNIVPKKNILEILLLQFDIPNQNSFIMIKHSLQLICKICVIDSKIESEACFPFNNRLKFIILCLGK